MPAQSSGTTTASGRAQATSRSEGGDSAQVRNAVGSTREFRPTRPSTTRSRRKSARPASSRTCACRVRASGSDAGAASQAASRCLAPRGRALVEELEERAVAKDVQVRV